MALCLFGDFPLPQDTKSSPGSPLAGVAAPAATGLSVAGLTAGLTADLAADPAAALDILEKAFDYRGDITLTLHDGREITGYLFDRRRGQTLADSTVRLMLPAPVVGVDGSDKLTVRYADIRRIAFSERDPAAGKSFETWVRKYVEKKLKGEKAGIESESLD